MTLDDSIGPLGSSKAMQGSLLSTFMRRTIYDNNIKIYDETVWIVVTLDPIGLTPGNIRETS